MEIINDFRQYLILKQITNKVTLKNYLSDVRHFIRWYEKSFRATFTPQELTQEAIRLYTGVFGASISAGKIENEEKMSSASLKRRLSSLRNFSQFLSDKGYFSQNPFQLIKDELESHQIEDKWHIQEFKDYLRSKNISDLTIKNYVADVHSFRRWYENVIEPNIVQTNFPLVNQQIVDEYKNRLIEHKKSAPRTINRKLSSIRKYFQFGLVSNYLAENNFFVDRVSPNLELNTTEQNAYKIGEIEKDKVNVSYSSIPPLRLFQKLVVLPFLISEAAISSKLASLIASAQIATKATSTAVNPLSGLHIPKSPSELLKVKGYEKEFFAPQKFSTDLLPFHKKVLFHLKYTRPEWYKKYHNVPIVHYIHFAILIIVAGGCGLGIYKSLADDPIKPLYAANNTPPRVLSFEKRLTDTNNRPITTPTDLRFGIYSDLSASGSALLWQEVHYGVKPDGNGQVSVLIGSRDTIPDEIFEGEKPLFLGVTVDDTTELSPRKRITDTVLAKDSQSLQSMLPITDPAAGTTNVLLALDSSGDLTIGENASPTFTATGGLFTLSGSGLLLKTNEGSGNDVIISPDGEIDAVKPLKNTSNNGLISPGAVEIHDKFAVVATESAVSAFLVDNKDTGDIFSASSSGITRFTIENDGTIKIPKYATKYGLLYTNESGSVSQTNAGAAGECLQASAGSLLKWGKCGDENAFKLKNGAFSTGNTTADLLIGSDATSAAKFAFINSSGTNNPTASISARTLNTSLSLSGDGTIQTQMASTLLLGGNTTGNIVFYPGGGNGRVGVNTASPLGTFDIRSNGNVEALRVIANTNSNVVNIENNGSGNLINAAAGGSNKFWVESDGDVYISGKLNVLSGQIDPLFAIDGKNYSTFAPGMLGVKEEASGKAKLKYDSNSGSYAYSLDFNNFEYQSDMWVFNRVIDPDINQVSVLLTPDSQANTWYKKNGTNRTITFYSDRPVEVSYRLTAPRFDHESVKTYNETASTLGLQTPNKPNPKGVGGNEDTQSEEDHLNLLTITEQNGIFSLKDKYDNALKQFGSFSKMVSANIKAGFIETKDVSAENIKSTLINTSNLITSSINTTKLTAQNLTSSTADITSATFKSITIGTENVFISGVSLRDYIAEVVSQVVLNTNLSSNHEIISPLASFDKTKTNFLSPLADNSSVGIELKQNSITVKNTQNDKPLLSIDDKGDASISGNLSSNSLETNNATVAGTLSADNIVAKNIYGLDEKISSIAGSIAKSNQATTPADLALNKLETGNLNSNFGVFSEELTILGTTTTSELTAMNSISIGTGFILTENSLNTIGATLEIQPQRQGDISFLAGKIRFDKDGNVDIEGNLNIAGNIKAADGVFNGINTKTLATNIISPLPDSNLVVKLGNTSVSSASGNVIFTDSNGKEIAKISGEGNLSASGSATVNKLNLNLVGEALADSPTTATATGSAGYATINKGKTEVTIYNNNVTKDSLIYITPFGDTQEKVLHLLRQTPYEVNVYGSKGSFTVGVSGIALSKDVQFNWLILN